MEEKTNENEPDGFVGDENTSKDIYCYSVISMQGMVIYPAAVGIEEGVCNYVIHIYQHSAKKNQIISFPVFYIIPVRNETDGDEVKEIMDEGLEHCSVLSCRLSVVGFF